LNKVKIGSKAWTGCIVQGRPALCVVSTRSMFN
jgi:hypothetical protein